jgi:hypothetical protein
MDLFLQFVVLPAVVGILFFPIVLGIMNHVRNRRPGDVDEPSYPDDY